MSKEKDWEEIENSNLLHKITQKEKYGEDLEKIGSFEKKNHKKVRTFNFSTKVFLKILDMAIIIIAIFGIKIMINSFNQVNDNSKAHIEAEKMRNAINMISENKISENINNEE